MTPDEIERCHRDADARAEAQGLPRFIDDPAFLHFAARVILRSLNDRPAETERAS